MRGVSTRRVEGLVQALGIERLSKSQVSRMATELDAEVAAFRSRPLDAGPYTYVSESPDKARLHIIDGEGEEMTAHALAEVS